MSDPLELSLAGGDSDAGGELLVCPGCAKAYRARNRRADDQVLCPACGGTLAASQPGATVDTDATRMPQPDPSQPTGPAVASSPRAPGRMFGRYRLDAELGRGGMGVVWKAWDTELKRIVALKQVLAEGNPAIVERFMREARAAARLRHPAIIAVHDVGVFDGQHYFTTDYVAGRSLEKVPKPLPPDQALSLVKTVAEALAYAHDQGIVHRDVKPANILLDGTGKPFVMDFGLAKEVGKDAGEGLTLSGEVLGTPAYMSPEQAAGEASRVGPASDQFSLGAVLYELLTGERPFQGRSLVETLNAVMDAEPIRPSLLDRRIAADVETIVLKAMEKDPARRYATMGDLAADIERHLEGDPVLARPVSGMSRIWRKGVKHRAVVIPTLAALLVGLSLGAWALLGTLRAQQERKAHDEAMELLEAGRPAIDEATRGLYSKDGDYAALVKKVEEGQASIEKAIEKAPNLAIAHLLLGRAWELRGYDDRAEASYRKAIEADPSFGPAHHRLGRLLTSRVVMFMSMNWGPSTRARVGELSIDAQRELEAATKGIGFNDPVSRDVVEAMLRFVVTDFPAVLRTASDGEKAHAGEMGVEDFYWLAGVAWGSNMDGPSDRYDRALAALDEAIRFRPRFPQALMYRAAIRERQRDVEGAIADCDDAIAMDPRMASAHVVRGNLQRDKGDAAGAIPCFDRALALDPRFAAALYYRSVAYHDQGDLDRAMADCEGAIAIEPGWGQLYAQRGEYRAAKEDLTGAIADYDLALKYDKELAWTWYNRGRARRATGDLEGSLKDLFEGAKLLPTERRIPAAAAVSLAMLHRDGDVKKWTDSAFAKGVRPPSDAFAARGLLELHRGQKREALADFTEFEREAPPRDPLRKDVAEWKAEAEK